MTNSVDQHDNVNAFGTPDPGHRDFTPALLRPGVIQFQSWPGSEFWFVATGGTCAWHVNGNTASICGVPAYWFLGGNIVNGGRCVYHGGYDPTNMLPVEATPEPVVVPQVEVALGWCLVTQFDYWWCESNGVHSPGRQPHARWFHGNRNTYACDLHVPMSDGTVGFPGTEDVVPVAPVPLALDFPFWVTSAEKYPWDRRGQVPTSSSYANDRTYQEVLPTAAPGGRSYNINRTSLDGVLRLLNRVDYGIQVRRIGDTRAVVIPKRMLTNEDQVQSRRRARQNVREARIAFQHAQAYWEGFKNVRAQYIEEDLLAALAQDISTWPEVMASAYGDEYVVTEDGSQFYPEQECILVRFWPAFFAEGDQYETQGLTAPVLFSINTVGNPKYLWPSNGGHPHTYSDGTICGGVYADFGNGILRGLQCLRDWWVGTDGTPLDGYYERSREFWQAFGERFFDQNPEAKYVLAPDHQDGEAQVLPLDRPKMIDLTYYNENPNRCECSRCGRAGDDEDNFYSCESHGQVCDSCYVDDGYCVSCAPKCSNCDNFRRDQYGELKDFDCTECGNSFCHDCFDQDYDRCTACVDLMEDEDEDEDEVNYHNDEALPDQIVLTFPAQFDIRTPYDLTLEASGGNYGDEVEDQYGVVDPLWHPISGYDTCTWPFNDSGLGCRQFANYSYSPMGDRCYQHVPRTNIQPIPGHRGEFIPDYWCLATGGIR